MPGGARGDGVGAGKEGGYALMQASRLSLPLGQYRRYDYLPYLAGLILSPCLTFPLAGPH